MTLDDGATTIILPDSLEWIDEYQFSSVKQDIQATIGGGLVVSESTVSAGRPITLKGGEFVWIDKSIVDLLDAYINTVSATFTLTLADARTFTVMFNRASAPMDAKPVWRKNVQDSTDKHTLTLRLMEV